MCVKLCFCNSGHCLKYSMYSVLKNSFMVLKQVLRKKKSNCFACFVIFGALTSISAECSEDFDPVDVDCVFSETGDGCCFSLSFNSLFLKACWSSFVSRRGSLNNLSIRATRSSGSCLFDPGTIDPIDES